MYNFNFYRDIVTYFPVWKIFLEFFICHRGDSKIELPLLSLIGYIDQTVHEFPLKSECSVFLFLCVVFLVCFFALNQILFQSLSCGVQT